MTANQGRDNASVSGGGDDLEHGVEEGWGKLADAFRANFEAPGEVGAACSVYVGGRPVANLWGGLADREANRPWGNGTGTPSAARRPSARFSRTWSAPSGGQDSQSCRRIDGAVGSGRPLTT
ncbi:hypothetical protein GCM10009609_17810 [Pseudonocardia aurantiaca]